MQVLFVNGIHPSRRGVGIALSFPADTASLEGFKEPNRALLSSLTLRDLEGKLYKNWA